MPDLFRHPLIVSLLEIAQQVREETSFFTNLVA